MNKLARRVLWTIVAAGCLGTVVWAQSPRPPVAGANPPEQPGAETFEPAQDFSAPRPRRGGLGNGGMGMGGGLGFRRWVSPMSDDPAHELALNQAIAQLKSAKNDAEKTAATNEISKLLEKSFQRDLAEREKHVSDVEARVKKLREQVEKRKKAKDEIISLRLKTIVNEADGLGFPANAQFIPGPAGPVDHEYYFDRSHRPDEFQPRPSFGTQPARPAPLLPPAGEDASPGPAPPAGP
jgi:hypothetical protein